MKKLVKWGLKRLGYRLVRTPEHWYALPECPRPRTVIDVGCAESTPELHVAFPDARYLLVDPVAEYEPAMRHLVDRHGGSCVIAAAAEAPGEAVINVDLEDPRKSSLFDRSALTSARAAKRVTSRAGANGGRDRANHERARPLRAQD
jgi:hypothetical protein